MRNSIKCRLFWKKRINAARTFTQLWLAIITLNTVAIALADYNVIQQQQQQQQQLHHQQQQQQQQYNRNAEGRKLFGGYRITPKHCRVSKVLRFNENETRSVAICMFNHECAQRGGEVVGACMDGFLFGACCQVPNTVDVEHTLINDAQNSNYHYQYQQKWHETNYELLNAENSTRAENNNNYVESNADNGDPDKFIDTASHTQNDMASVYPTLNIVQIPQDSVKITPSSRPVPQEDDLVMQALNTLSTYVGPSRIPTHTTELPMKIDINANSNYNINSNTNFNTNSNINSNINSNSYHHKDKESNKVKVKPSFEVNSNAMYVQQNSIQSTASTSSSKPSKPTKPPRSTMKPSKPQTPSPTLLANHTHLDISSHYNKTPVKLNVTKIDLNESNHQDQFVLVHTLTNDDDEKEPLKNATTTVSSITTHSNAIETIIQQLNNSNQTGPTYTIVEHQTVSAISDYNHNENLKTNSTKHTDSLLADFSPVDFEEQTVPSTNYDDHITLHNHQTSEFNKMPSLGIAYPVDVSYIDEDDPVLITNTIKQKPIQSQHTPSPNIYGNGNMEEQQQYQQQPFEKPLVPVHTHKKNVTVMDKEKPINIIEYPMSHVNEYTNEKPKPLEHYGDGDRDRPIPEITEQSIQSRPLQSNANISIAQATSQNIPYEKDTPVTIIKGSTNDGYFMNNISKPLDSFPGLVTSQSYNPLPILPSEVLVSSSTTLVQEPLRGQSELYTTMITVPNKLATTIKPFSSLPSMATTTTTTTMAITPPSKLITQYYTSKQPLMVTTKIPEKHDTTSPLLLYGQHISSSTDQSFYPGPSINQASTNYGTTSRPPPTNIDYHYNDVPPLIITNDKLDSLSLATGDQVQSSSEPSFTNQQQAYGEPIYLNSVAPLKVQISSKPEQTINAIKIPVTINPPSPTVHITPKPTKQQTILSSTPAYQQINSMASSHNTFITKLPAPLSINGVVSINPNDFYDPGYYAVDDKIKSTTEFAVPSDDRPAFPGYYGPTPIYPTFPVPNEKEDTDVEEETYTSPNDFVNFPPVRNPNLNMTVTLSPVTTDFQLSTPAFVEDGILKNKMNTLVSKIVESLQDNFEALAEMIDDPKVSRPSPSYQQTAATNNVLNQKPVRKPSTKATTTKPRTTTRKPTTRITTKASTKRPTTRRPTTTTKRVVSRRTTTTTQRPISKKPIKKTTTTTTRAPIQADEYNANEDEEDEDVNPSANEIDATQTQIGAGSRKFQCGVRPQLKSGRIVGGKGATFGAYPWQVLVRESTWLGLFTKNKCGGVLITSRFVITAAHCQPGFLASLVAVMGEFDISGDSESKRSVTKNVKRVIVHRHYDPATFENDIALLELDSPVQFDTHIIPICMPADKADFTGRMATVTGWGRLKYGGGVPSILQEVQVPIIENSVCQEMFNTAGHNKRIINSFLCAGYANGQKDSCEGDSGGPLVLKRPDGRYELAGTVSHGIKCAAPYLPGVYMRTTFYKPWLRTITAIK